MFRFLLILLMVFVLCAITIAQDIDPYLGLNKVNVHIISIETQWTATGDQIVMDSIYNIWANGIANATGKTAAYSSFWVGPEGYGNAGGAAPVVSVPAYSLIGKIGASGTPFYVGRGITFKANVSGELYLGYNDTQFYDNYGYYIAYVSGYGIPTSVNEQVTISNEFSLSQNYPNPFNPSTAIEYKVSKQGNVNVAIYDINGRLVKTLLNSNQYPGSYTIQWNGQDDNGNMVSSGTYFYQVKSDGIQLVKKMLMLK